MRLSGKTVIVTGGAQGIGADYSRAFASEGANVIVADLLEAEGEALVQALTDGREGGALFVKTDVTRDEDTKRLAAKAEERFGSIDVLINNAAIYLDLGQKKPFDEISVEEWDKVMAVNARGIWHCVKAVAPYMRQQERGKIVNISSVVERMGAGGFAHYVASKAAVSGLTRALARELGAYNINVNSVSPGLVANEATREVNLEEYVDQASKARSIQREMKPDDLVGTVLFLASSGSDFITGQNFIVDGGAVMS